MARDLFKAGRLCRVALTAAGERPLVHAVEAALPAARHIGAAQIRLLRVVAAPLSRVPHVLLLVVQAHACLVGGLAAEAIDGDEEEKLAEIHLVLS